MFQNSDDIHILSVPRDPRRYLVLDVEWSKHDAYVYEVHELTKAGTLHKGRYATPLSPSRNISVELCEEPLPEETRRRAESARRTAGGRLEAVLQTGDLAMFAPTKRPAPPPAQRRYSFWAR